MRGWGLRRAGDAAGIAPNTWQRIERGDEVEYSTVVRAIVAFGWPASDADLLNVDPSKVPSAGEPAEEGEVDEVVAALRRSRQITADQRELLIVAYRGAVARTQGGAGQVDGEQHHLA